MMSHENFLIKYVYNICTRAEKHGAKGEKYNNKSFIHFGFISVTRNKVGIFLKRTILCYQIGMTMLTICHLNCGLISPVVPLLPPFPLHSLCPALFSLHTRATSSLTVMLSSCLVPVVPCNWGHKKRSWKQMRGEKVRRRRGKNITVPVILQHRSYGARACPENLAIKETKLQCLQKLLFRNHRCTNLEASTLVKVRKICTGTQKKARTICKGTQPYAEFQVLTSKFRLS